MDRHQLIEEINAIIIGREQISQSLKDLIVTCKEKLKNGLESMLWEEYKSLHTTIRQSKKNHWNKWCYY